MEIPDYILGEVFRARLALESGHELKQHHLNDLQTIASTLGGVPGAIAVMQPNVLGLYLALLLIENQAR